MKSPRIVFLLLFALVMSTPPVVWSWSRLPFYEGFVRLSILKSSPELILCTLEVSGGVSSELMAIDPTGQPRIIWRSPSKGKNYGVFAGRDVWDVFWEEDGDLFVLEGTLLQRRRKTDGKILKEVDVSEFETETSKQRPWHKMEKQLNALNENPEENQDEITNLRVDIETMKEEWRIMEARAEAYGGKKEAKFDKVRFLGSTKNSICIERVRYRPLIGAASKLFEEMIFLDPKTFQPMSLEDVEWEENQQIPNTKPSYPYELHINGNVELKSMDVEEKKESVTLIASDLKKKKTLWRLGVPVVMKRIQEK